MKLNIFAGLLFALLLAVGVNTKADAQCCRWHRYYYHSCEHMCCNDKDKDKDKDKTKTDSSAAQGTIDPAVPGTAEDNQLARAVDLLRGISLFKSGHAVN